MISREDAQPATRRQLVYAIMPGDPGPPNTGHIVNYRVDDIDAVVAGLRADGTEATPVTLGEDADGSAVKLIRTLCRPLRRTSVSTAN